jgi:hypothetical protein
MNIDESFNCDDLFSRFLSDLEDAKVYERYVAKVFEEIGFKTIGFNNDKRYDIMMQNPIGKTRLIEVKKDFKSAYTGNIVFEYVSHSKPSGIEATKSDYWVSVYPDELWIIRTKKLKQCIEFYNSVTCNDLDNCWNWVTAGDGKNTRCYLWNKQVFKNIIGDDLKILKRNDIPNEKTKED